MMAQQCIQIITLIAKAVRHDRILKQTNKQQKNMILRWKSWLRTLFEEMAEYQSSLDHCTSVSQIFDTLNVVPLPVKEFLTCFCGAGVCLKP